MENVLQPGAFLHRVNFDLRQFEFLPITRKKVSRETFLDENALGGFALLKRVPFDNLFSEIDEKGKNLALPESFIFHTGFCCSTLLMKAIDNPGKILSLREPNAFLNLCHYKRRPDFAREQTAPFRRVLGAALKLLNKPFVNSENSLIKPSNTANNLIPDIFDINPKAKGVLLFQDQESFLISFLKKSEPGRMFARQLFMTLGLDEGAKTLGFHKQYGGLTDLQVISLLWVLQIFQFSRVFQTYPGRFLLVKTNDFLENPEQTLGNICRFLRLDPGEKGFQDIGSERVFSTNSKFRDRFYSPEKREEERNRIKADYAQSLKFIQQWSAPFIETANISPLTRAA